MDTQTESSHISESMTDIIKISKANPGFSTTTSLKKVSQTVQITTDKWKWLAKLKIALKL